MAVNSDLEAVFCKATPTAALKRRAAAMVQGVTLDLSSRWLETARRHFHSVGSM